jgi:two-component sensor histidine kinase
MRETGFSIRCPHCFEWSDWTTHPRDLIISPGSEAEDVVQGLMDQPHAFSHPKMLVCKSPAEECAAPFQAFVFDNQHVAHEMAQRMPSWALRRAFRLYGSDHFGRWEHYHGVIICTRYVPRQKHIELEKILDRELLSRASTGIAVEVNSPVTAYAATVFEAAGRGHKCWVPVEGYSTDLRYVPPRYNLFCEICRQVTIDAILPEFVDKSSPANCPMALGITGTCAGRIPACMNDDWNHCPAFLEKRREVDPCYQCDCRLISQLEEKWRHRKGDRHEYDTHTCWAGFTEIAIPVEVHEHLIAVLMTGQFLVGQDNLPSVTALLHGHPLLEACKGKLSWARDLLCGEGVARNDKERYTKHFRIGEAELMEIVKRIQGNRDRIAKIAYTRYRQYRSRSETAFRNELTGTLDAVNTLPNAESALVMRILARMQEFWAFRGVYLLTWERRSGRLSVDAFTSLSRVSTPLAKLKVVGTIDMEFSQSHPLTWLYDRERNCISSPNLWAKEFQKLFYSAMQDNELNVPTGPYYFMVAVPFAGNIYVFVFAVRDEESVSPLRPLQKGGISELCQEAILDTCINVIRRLGEFWYQQERGKEIQFDAWKYFSWSMAHRIANEAFVMSAVQRRFKRCVQDEEDIEDMQKYIDNISGICRDLMYFSIEKSPRLSDFDLRGLIAEVTRQFQKAVDNITITSNVAPDEMICRWDRGQVHYVLVELLQNAACHTQAGGRVHIAGSLHESRGIPMARIEVFNTGRGIPYEDKRHVFEPFFSKRVGGMGLGLSTVADIVKKHSGAIYENGEPGENANFVIDIPQKPRREVLE